MFFRSSQRDDDPAGSRVLRERVSAYYVCALLLILLAFGLRVYRIDTQSVWSDEAFSIYAASLQLDALIKELSADHTPFYYTLLHYWVLLTGNSEYAVRFLSAFFGVLLIALVYRAGCNWAGREAALLAGLMATLSAFTVYYSQEARMHMQATSLGLISVLLLQRAVKRNTMVSWLFYALTTAAVIYSYLFTSLLVAAQGCYLVLSGSDRRRMMRWLFSMALVAVLLAPFLVYDILKMSAFVGFMTRGLVPLDPLTFMGNLWGFIFVGHAIDQQVLRLSALVLLLPAGVAAIGVLRRARLRFPFSVGDIRLLPLTCFVVPAALAFLVNTRIPTFQPRFLLFAAPYAFLLAAMGMVRLANAIERRFVWRKGSGSWILTIMTLTVVGLMGTGLWFVASDARYARDDYRSLVQRIENESPAGSAVILDAPWQDNPFFYYYQETPIDVYGLPEEGQSREELTTSLKRIIAGHPIIWLVLYGNAAVDPDNLVEGWLGEQAFKTDEDWYGQVRLVRYVGRVPNSFDPTALSNPIAYHFSGGLSLVAFEVSALPSSAVNAITIELIWQARTAIASDYVAYIHVIDDTNVRIGQNDSIPLGPSRPTSLWQVGETVRDVRRVDVPPGKPSGFYRIELGLYKSTDGQRSEVRAATGQSLGDHLELGTIDISGKLGSPQEPASRREAGVTFGEQLLLQSWAFPTEVWPSNRPQGIGMEWQALRHMPEDYKFFIHLLDRFGNLVAQVDSPPGNGYKPTSAWQEGQRLTDYMVLPIPKTIPSDRYLLCAGVYEPSTMRRLPPSTQLANGVRCGQDAIELGEVEVGNK